MTPRALAASSESGRTRAEWIALSGLGLAMLLAFVLPSYPQWPAYHHFADARTFIGVHNAANVLTNLAFVAAGVAIALGLRRTAAAGLLPVTRRALVVTVIGLLLIAAGSGYYHSIPDDHTLFWDRLPMTIAFAGVVGAALAQRVSARAGSFGMIALLIVGPASLLYWRISGNIVPYGVLQGGVVVAVLLLAFATARRDDPFPWAWVVGLYLVAKVAEYFDAGIFNLTAGVMSGHSVKHVVAAAGVAVLAYPLWKSANGAAVTPGMPARAS